MAVKYIILYTVLILIMAEFRDCYTEKITENDIEELRQFLSNLENAGIEKESPVIVPGELSPPVEPWIDAKRKKRHSISHIKHGSYHSLPGALGRRGCPLGYVRLGFLCVVS